MKTKLWLWYLVACAIWFVVVATYVPWVGVTYERRTVSHDIEDLNFVEWQPRGRSFKLVDDDAPIWSPPEPKDTTPWTVRLPAQKVSQRNCVEIAVGRLMMRLSLGMIAVGLAAGGFKRLFLGGRLDPVVDFGWWLALGELLVLVVYYLAQWSPLDLAFSSRAFDDLFLKLSFLAGALVGGTLFVLERRRGTAAERKEPKSETPEEHVPEPEALVADESWFTHPSLSTLLLAPLIVGLFFGELFAIRRLPYQVAESLLVILAVAHALAPIAMWWLPAKWRWPLWTLVFLGILVGAHHGKAVPQGVLLALGSIVGASAGLVVSRLRGRNAATARSPRYSWAIFGLIAGLFCLMPTVPLLVSITDSFRGEVVPSAPSWAGVSRQYDDAVMMLLGCIYAGMALVALRLGFWVRRVGWWRGLSFGMFVFATAVGVFAFCWH